MEKDWNMLENYVSIFTQKSSFLHRYFPCNSTGYYMKTKRKSTWHVCCKERKWSQYKTTGL